ncbi:MAG: guanylate kinase [Chlorobi bacterium]|nr:guanylate kinase [Chlorobiota bacterium]MCI0716753.1 guanylate kinase [Chlorobiota bacterium]
MLFVISAPSGAGKTTIIKELFKLLPELEFSVSATTRKKRDGETDGKDYYFISQDDFKKKIDGDEFVEYEEVFGNYYGTLKSEVEPCLGKNRHLIFDVDVKGALSLKKLYPEAVTVFIDVTLDELVERLKTRGTESNEEIEKRISRIKEELEQKKLFDYIVPNPSKPNGLQNAVKEVEKIINKYK